MEAGIAAVSIEEPVAAHVSAPGNSHTYEALYEIFWNDDVAEFFHGVWDQPGPGR